tara:strand:+ start:166 stop:549 length:384 start_codon:yes stop_codon:yes gene_type:complete
MGIETYNEMNPYSSYIYECCCGERYRNVAAAAVCKKCRNYSVWGYTKYVINIKTDEVVYGTMPTDEEYATAAAAAEERWAEEQAAWQQQQEEDERQWWLQRDEVMKALAEEEEDRLYDIQDKMSGNV